MKIVIASGKGGAGKTTVAASLAALWGRQCVAVDADVEAPNLHLFLHPSLTASEPSFLTVPELRAEVCTSCGKCREICRYNAIAGFAGHMSFFPEMCHGCGGCFAVCPSNALKKGRRELGVLKEGTFGKEHICFLAGQSRIGEAMTPPLLRALDRRLAGVLHRMPEADAIIDAPPGVSCPAMTVAGTADVLVLVAEPTPFGIYDFRLAREAFAKTGLPLAVIINRAGMEGNAAGDTAVRELCTEWNLPLLGELPFERAAAEEYAHGRMLAEVSPAWRERFIKLAAQVRKFAPQHKNSGKGNTRKAKPAAGLRSSAPAPCGGPAAPAGEMRGFAGKMRRKTAGETGTATEPQNASGEARHV